MILTFGNNLYRDLGYVNEHLALEEIPHQLTYDGHHLDITKRHYYQGKLETLVDSAFLQFLQNEDGALLVTPGFSTAIFERNSIYYVFDSHSRNRQGMVSPFGTSVLLQFNSRDETLSYIKDLYLVDMGKPQCLFQLQVLRITSPFKEYLATSLRNSRRRHQRKKQSKERKENLDKIAGDNFKQKIDKTKLRMQKKSEIQRKK